MTRRNDPLENKIRAYVEANIGTFHQKRLDSLRQLQLKLILKRKNPYLFKAKYIIAAPDLVKLILDAHLSSQEETLFGEFLESLAIYICGQIYGGVKSTRPSIDLEFRKKDVYYIVSIKSGPNWGNADQIRKMRENFEDATAELKKTKEKPRVVGVNGCCYGQDSHPDKGDYYKYCGQDFWEFISGDKELYTRIIEPLGFKAKEKNEEFQAEYAKIITNFTVEFASEFCDDGEINWARLVAFNSARSEPARRVKEKKSKYSTQRP